MNKQQRKFLWIGITIFVLMGLFPPQMWTQGDRDYVDSGYGFIFAITRNCRIDAPKLFVQWSMVAAVTGGLLLTLRNNKKS
jgi:hypothetical protein